MANRNDRPQHYDGREYGLPCDTSAAETTKTNINTWLSCIPGVLNYSDSYAGDETFQNNTPWKESQPEHPPSAQKTNQAIIPREVLAMPFWAVLTYFPQFGKVIQDHLNDYEDDYYFDSYHFRLYAHHYGLYSDPYHRWINTHLELNSSRTEVRDINEPKPILMDFREVNWDKGASIPIGGDVSPKGTVLKYSKP